MLLLGQIMWITLFLYIDFFLPQSCKAALEAKEIWRQKDARHPSKPARKLLDWKKIEPTLQQSSVPENNVIVVILLVIFFLVMFILGMIKCCQYYSNLEIDSRLTPQPPSPPRRSGGNPPNSNSGSRRPLAPPMTTSRSLILLPEEGFVPALFIGMENSYYNQIPINVSDRERMNTRHEPPRFDPTPINVADLQRRNNIHEYLLYNPLPINVSDPERRNNRREPPRFDPINVADLQRRNNIHEYTHYDPLAINVADLQRRNDTHDNPINALDLPPDYDTAVKMDSQNRKWESTVNPPNVRRRVSEESALPKYVDTHNMK